MDPFQQRTTLCSRPMCVLTASVAARVNTSPKPSTAVISVSAHYWLLAESHPRIIPISSSNARTRSAAPLIIWHAKYCRNQPTTTAPHGGAMPENLKLTFQPTICKLGWDAVLGATFTVGVLHHQGSNGRGRRTNASVNAKNQSSCENVWASAEGPYDERWWRATSCRFMTDDG